MHHILVQDYINLMLPIRSVNWYELFSCIVLAIIMIVIIREDIHSECQAKNRRYLLKIFLPTCRLGEL